MHYFLVSYPWSRSVSWCLMSGWELRRRRSVVQRHLRSQDKTNALEMFILTEIDIPSGSCSERSADDCESVIAFKKPLRLRNRKSRNSVVRESMEVVKILNVKTAIRAVKSSEWCGAATAKSGIVCVPAFSVWCWTCSQLAHFCHLSTRSPTTLSSVSSRLVTRTQALSSRSTTKSPSGIWNVSWYNAESKSSVSDRSSYTHRS